MSNFYRLTISPNTQQINIPIKVDFDQYGKEQDYIEFENEAIEKVINPPQDFEVSRFAHSTFIPNNIQNSLSTGDGKIATDINYKMFFFDDTIFLSASTINNWQIDYRNQGFTTQELYFSSNSFKNSFFKLDFYDTQSTEQQKIYFTLVLPTQQGLKIDATIESLVSSSDVEIRTPNFLLDYVGDKEGFFIYWLKNKDYIDINEFYMSCKFFNAKTGEFIRLMNTPQALLPNQFNFNKNDNFYYKCVLNYETYEYEMFLEDPQGNLLRVGTTDNPINFYEYINP